MQKMHMWPRFLLNLVASKEDIPKCIQGGAPVLSPLGQVWQSLCQSPMLDVREEDPAWGGWAGCPALAPMPGVSRLFTGLQRSHLAHSLNTTRAFTSSKGEKGRHLCRHEHGRITATAQDAGAEAAPCNTLHGGFVCLAAGWFDSISTRVPWAPVPQGVILSCGRLRNLSLKQLRNRTSGAFLSQKVSDSLGETGWKAS